MITEHFCDYCAKLFNKEVFYIEIKNKLAHNMLILCAHIGAGKYGKRTMQCLFLFYFYL